jgi:excisionase family DNA binding protein
MSCTIRCRATALSRLNPTLFLFLPVSSGIQFGYAATEPEKALTMKEEDRWLSVDELAAYLGVKPDTVYTWIGKKNLPAHKMGRLWKMKRSEVDAWVRSGKAAQSEEG